MFKVEKIVERVKDKSLRDIGEKVLEDKRISRKAFL